MGSYQVLGDLHINLTDHNNYTNYKRELDIGDAIATINYTSNGIKYSREYFASHPSNVLVAHFTADKSKGYSGKINLVDSHNGTVKVTNNVITVSGSLNNNLKYEWEALILNSGGTVTANGSAIDVKDSDSITIIISAATNYLMDSSKSFRSSANIDTFVTNTAKTASQITYENLKADHIKDFQSLFNRLTLDLGQSSSSQLALTTDKRKVAAITTFDPDFEELLFQYGRYLLISSSRPGTLPANLQVMHYFDIN
jgi:alpha-L-fucosidase 2